MTIALLGLGMALVAVGTPVHPKPPSRPGEFYPEPLTGRVEDWRRVPRGLSLSVAPRFLWECLTSRTVGRFPAPAASNPAGGFPALGFPACFMPKLMGPILLVGLSAQTPTFGYSAPHPSARGTSTLPINALLSAHYEPIRHPLDHARGSVTRRASDRSRGPPKPAAGYWRCGRRDNR